MVVVAEAYVLNDLVLREQWRGALLLLALAGVGLLFLRSGVARIVGMLLILVRLLAMPVTGTESAMLGAIALIGCVALACRQREREAASPPPRSIGEAPERDDAGEAAPCPACRGVIPSGMSRCPTCGWTYLAEKP
jgi:hypothetical protein